MQKRTIIDRIEIEPQTGNIAVRMRKQVVDDDGAVLASEYHRAMIEAELADPAALLALVDGHLATLGFPAVKAEDRAVLDTALATFDSLRAEKAQEKRASAALEALVEAQPK